MESVAWSEERTPTNIDATTTDVGVRKLTPNLHAKLTYRDTVYIFYRSHKNRVHCVLFFYGHVDKAVA